jgi:hypothetical protein
MLQKSIPAKIVSFHLPLILLTFRPVNFGRCPWHENASTGCGARAAEPAAAKRVRHPAEGDRRDAIVNSGDRRPQV